MAREHYNWLDILGFYFFFLLCHIAEYPNEMLIRPHLWIKGNLQQ